MADKPHIRSPDKFLRHSEEHFQGYWIQLQSLIRRDDDADELLATCKSFAGIEHNLQEQQRPPCKSNKGR